MAQRNQGTQVTNGNYKIPNKASAYVQAPNTIQKDGNSPQKATGGDLRGK